MKVCVNPKIDFAQLFQNFLALFTPHFHQKFRREIELSGFLAVSWRFTTNGLPSQIRKSTAPFAFWISPRATQNRVFRFVKSVCIGSSRIAFANLHKHSLQNAWILTFTKFYNLCNFLIISIISLKLFSIELRNMAIFKKCFNICGSCSM